MALAVPAAGGSMSLALLDDPQLRENLVHLCLRGDTQKVLAVFEELPEKAKALLSAPMDADGNSGLHLVAMHGHLRLLQELISRGCETNAKNTRLQTPLHVATCEDRAELVLELLIAKCEVDAEDDRQQTALHNASILGELEVMRVLLEHGGANPALGESTRSTPLLLTAHHGRVDQMELLLSKDPGLVNAANENGWTALHLAAHGQEKKKSSLKGAKFLPAVKLLLEAKAAVDAVDEDSRTALHRAADTGNCETVSALLAAGANIMAEDISRWTPLHFACQDGHVGVARTLLQAKAAVQREHITCLTPLALATMENQVKVAELLVSHKADPNLRAKGLASAAMVARKDPEKYNDILSLFELGFVHHAD